MSETEIPTAQVTAERSIPADVTDSKGRVLVLRKMGALQKLRLFKACGANAASQPYLGMAMLAASVAEIDGVSVAQPVNEQQVEALVQRLGDEGLEAVGNALSPEAADPDAVLDAAKN